MPYWSDIYRVFKYSFASDPISRKANSRLIDGVGVTAQDMPTLRPDNFTGAGNRSVRLRETNDFIDLNSASSRTSRYKEYERLMYVAEIDSALTIFANECCIAGNSKVMTPFGTYTIKELAETKAPHEKFLVYCYDFVRQDYTLGWAYHPRFVREAETIELLFDNAERLTLTPDHLVLTRDGFWVAAGELKEGSELMPFYRERATSRSHQKTNQFPRIYTHQEGWKHERHFVDEWRLGKKLDRYENFELINRRLRAGMNMVQITKSLKLDKDTCKGYLAREGFSRHELDYLYKRHEDRRRVIGIAEGFVQPVYDLSVEKHENFATNGCIVHNCQKGANNHFFDILCKNEEVKKEAEFFFFKLLKMDRRLWNIAKKLFQMGDLFLENVIDPENPSAGILKVNILPSDTMYRIETTKGKLLEFQQSSEGPDYQSLARVDVDLATEQDLAQATALRFKPEQIVHMRIGDDRKTFYPYGVSLIEPARGPAHQLRMMEDAMVVYRLTRSPERRVFYIDMGSIQHHKAESLIERMKDQMRKKKTFSGRGGQAAGASSVEERWHAPAADEDIWLPTRPNSNTRVETLPGACLALDTKIPLLDGRILTLAEIIKEREEGKQNWVYSCNPENGAFAPGRITWAGVTRRNTDVVRITFDNGESVVCTPDHKFPIIGKGKVQAKDLLIGESMIPFNTRMAKMPPKFKYDYLQLYDVNKKEWEFVHRLVGKYVINTKFYQEHVFSELYKNERKGVLHHYDFNRFNNSPENLFWMNWNDHKVLHRTMPDNVREKMRQSLIKFHEKLDSSDPFYDRLRASAKKGSESLCEKLLDENYNKEFCRKQSQGWIKAKETNPELHKARGEKISKRNLNYWSNPNNKKEVFAKQTVNYPQEIFDYFVELLKEGKLIEEIIPLINDEKLIKKYIEANQHIKRNVDFSKGLAKDNINKMVKAYGFSGIRQLRKSLDTDKTPSNFNGGRKKGGGLKYPKVIMDIFMKYLSEGKSVTESLKLINSNQELLSLFNKAKEGIGYKTDLTGLMTSGHALKMVKHFGYEGLTHAREQASFYNHKVVKVEFLTEKIDTGTITVDGNHELHDYHTFAISPCGVYTCNSNLGDIDDAIYFRRKLLIALNMPQNYMSPEDPSITAKTLSVQNVTFAKFVERLQMSLEDGLLELLERHLRLRGFPQDTFDDLELIMTPPSAYREMSEQEVQALRYANAGAMAGQMAQYDIFVEIMKIPEAKAKELAMRAKMQKIEDAKIQAMVSNPEYVGVGQMGNEGTELGGEAGGPNPMLGPQPPQGNQPPPPPSPPSDGAEGNAAGNAAGGPLGREKKPDAQPLPNPTDQDLKKYDLEIRDYSLEKDEEEIDPVSLGE